VKETTRTLLMDPSLIMHLAMITSCKESKSQILWHVCHTFHQQDDISPMIAAKCDVVKYYLKANYDPTLLEFIPLQPLPSSDLCIVRSTGQPSKGGLLTSFVDIYSFKLLVLICVHPTFRSLMHIIFQIKNFFHQIFTHCINQDHIPIQQEILEMRGNSIWINCNCDGC